MMYTVQLKTRAQQTQPLDTIKIEASDVNLTTAETTDDNGNTVSTPLDYNFLGSDGEKSVARIPFENVYYIAKL